jgi:hypothetical protein
MGELDSQADGEDYTGMRSLTKTKSPRLHGAPPLAHRGRARSGCHAGPYPMAEARRSATVVHCTPTSTIVGMPDTAVQEARERVGAAVRNSGLVFPPRRTTVNLAQTELRTSGFPIWPIADDRNHWRVAFISVMAPGVEITLSARGGRCRSL